jgi:hypothetical protein
MGGPKEGEVMRHIGSRRSIPAAVLIVLAAETGGCGGPDADDLGTAVLTVVDLSEEVQGWRLRAEARAADLDGSPTFYFSDSEEVAGSSMTSAEITVGARSYVLVVELADRSTDELRVCEADLVISEDESVALSVDAGSIVEASPTEPPGCSLELERSPSR